MSDVSISLLPVSTYETIPMTSRLPDGEEKKPDQEARAEEQPQREQVINDAEMKSQQFHELLVLNIPDDVEHILNEKEFDICKFLTRKQLGKLLKDTKDNDECGASADLLNKLLKKTGEEDIVEQVDKLVESCLGYTINYGAVAEDPSVAEEVEETSCKYIWRELFVWALLHDRQELADMFWKRTSNNTAMALVASILLHALAEKADEKALHGSLNSHASEFEKRAIEVLNQCYKDDKPSSEELVKIKVDECGDKSILMIAHVEYMEFMDETCCDVVIQNQWTGKLYEPTQDQASRGVCATIQDILNDRYFSPRTKFVLHMVFYAIMLVKFSVMLLTELPRESQDSYIGLLEWSVCVLMFTWIIHEVAQMIKSGCKEHWSNDWNKIDMIGCVFFILSFLLRLGGQLDGGLLNGGLLDGGQLNSSQMDSGLLNFARGCYSVAILLLYIRYLQVFVVFKSIGPYVFMVRLAVLDLLKFLLVLALFIVSYGVASRALLFPKSELSYALLRDIVYLPYWQMYGELQLEEIEDANSHDGLNSLAIVLFAIYMMMSHILLLSLLIATFSHSITRIHDEKKKLWHFYFRSLVREYERCIIVPPPFSTLVYVYQLCRLLWLLLLRKCGNPPEQDSTVDRKERTELQQFENAKMYKYLRSLEKAPVAEHADEANVARLQSLEETVNIMRGMLEEIKRQGNKEESNKESSGNVSEKAGKKT